MDSTYDYYSLSKIDEDPDDLFKQTHGLFEEVQEVMENLTPAQADAYEKDSVDSMVSMIFGSNFIEKAGSEHNITLKICEKIFFGLSVPSEIPDRDPEYLATRNHLIQQGLDASYSAVIRSRRETIQHAKASSDKSSTYAGMYRKVMVSAGFNGFVSPASIPSAMRNLVQDFNRDITKAEQEGALDPFSLAAKYCHKFVNIHPFVDGNGRMCRLLLNAVLLKYAGIVIPLGEEEPSRTAYLEVATRASEMESLGVDDDEQSVKPAWSGLSSLLIKEACTRFKTFRERLRAAA
ncbi:hypothetical protein VC83_02370 [Pseudogymnoascus destructans]|uniref:Fido domain-containing protein n=1 Tax=Pseudogymnoascus destructans TaxID=655981 RepID=A0A177AG85_9PEZI|nr:uncharacterized protein VC83_02370 [Pseudogymnoascus destructans]OAF61139.1 hypothetical protein VC83_02370 [Pseudogymnoascus destructans]